jgi:cobalt/nickel transport system permease protein
VRLIDRNAQTNRWRRVAAIEKVAFSLGMIVLALLSPSWTVQGLIVATMLALTFVGAGVPLRDMLVSASVPAGFILASSLAQILTVRIDHFVPQVGISVAALGPACFIGLRSLAGVSALLFLALTTPLTDILRLLRRAGLSAEVSDIALMMFRFVWLTLDCLESSRRAQANRLGFVGYRRSLRSTGMLLANLLPRVMGRANRLEAGMAARGYTGELTFITREEGADYRRLLAAAGLIVAMAILGRIVI